MADNMDEFEQENFDASEPPPEKNNNGGLKNNLMEAWRTQPLFKLMVIMIFVGIAIAGALGAFSGPPKPEQSKIVNTPGISEAPGGKASPYFIEQNTQANQERASAAMKQGTSAMPTPVGQNVDLGDLGDKKQEDPLAEFRAETERLKQEMHQEKQQNAQQIQIIQQQVQQKPPEREDDSLARAMQKQMQELMAAWTPRNMKVVEGTEPKEKEQPAKPQNGEILAQTSATQVAFAAQQKEKTIVQAGTVNYAQMLTEANSDVPGPILAQVLSGPFTGGRAIGHFKTMTDFLIIEFNLINFKGKDYPVKVLALDPDTTLGGLVTEVDHRYFDRVILPAAASFVSEFGSQLGQGGSNVTVSGDTVLVEQASKSYKEALYSGLGQAGKSVGQFLQQEAQQIKPLVRVATGTPMGLFFLTSVKETADGTPVQPMLQQGVGMDGYAAIPGYGAINQAANPYGTSSYGTTSPGMTYPGSLGGNLYLPSSGSTTGMQQIPGTSMMVIPSEQTRLGTTILNR